MSRFKVGYLIGSLSSQSINRKLAKALIKLAPDGMDFHEIVFRELPLYSPDYDADFPQVALDFKAAIAASDAVLFVTPEYNRSIPGALKNALDVGSRPYGSSVWGGKPGAVISASPGAIGGFGANHHLRQTFVFLDIPCMQQPEAYLGGISDEAFDAQGGFADERMRSFVQGFVDAYAGWVEAHSARA